MFIPLPELKIGYLLGNRKGDLLLYMGNSQTYEISSEEGWSVMCNHDPVSGLNRAQCRQFDIMFVVDGRHKSLKQLRETKIDRAANLVTLQPYVLWVREAN